MAWRNFWRRKQAETPERPSASRSFGGPRGVVTRIGPISESDFDENARQIEAELSSGDISWPFYIAYGQKSR